MSGWPRPSGTGGGNAVLVESGSPAKVSAFPAAAALTGLELLPLVQGGADVRSTVSTVTGVSPALLVESGAAKKISALPAASALTGAELVPVVQGGADVQTTTGALLAIGSTPTAFGSGTQTAIIGTEHILSAPNIAGVFQLVIDTSAMVAGDVLELRAYGIVLTGGTTRVQDLGRYAGAQATDDLVKRSDAFLNDLTDANSLKFTLTQTFGTGRAFPWKVLRL